MQKSTAAVIIKNNKILIAKRKPGGTLGDKWEFPGGKVEIDETPEEREEKIKTMLFEIVKDDEDLGILLLCFDDGIYKPSDIAKETGWEISKVYNLKRKLQCRALKIKEIILLGD